MKIPQRSHNNKIINVKEHQNNHHTSENIINNQLHRSNSKLSIVYPLTST